MGQIRQQLGKCPLTHDSLERLPWEAFLPSWDGLFRQVLWGMQHIAVHGHAVLRHGGAVPQLGHHQQVPFAAGPAHNLPQLHTVFYALQGRQAQA